MTDEYVDVEPDVLFGFGSHNRHRVPGQRTINAQINGGPANGPYADLF
jgi:hypothetical protein